MNYAALKEKLDFLRQHAGSMPEAVREKYDRDFAIRYAHNSTAIEGNTLTLMETKLVLENPDYYINAIRLLQEQTQGIELKQEF